MKLLIIVALAGLTVFLSYQYGNSRGFDRGWDKGYIRGLENPQNYTEGK